MDKLIYIPDKEVCSTEMNFYIDNGFIFKMEIIDACPGNSEAVSKLSEGKRIDVIEKALCGIQCDGKETSCPDQVSKALSLYKVIKNNEKVKEKYTKLGLFEENVVLEKTKQKTKK